MGGTKRPPRGDQYTGGGERHFRRTEQARHHPIDDGGDQQQSRAGIGAGTIHTLHAQAKPPIYMIGNNEVINPEGYARDYLPPAQAAIKAHGGRYIAAGKGTVIDGEPPKGRVVILVWDSMEQLLGWRHSPEYEAARKIGEKYAKYNLIAVEGVSPK